MWDRGGLVAVTCQVPGLGPPPSPRNQQLPSVHKFCQPDRLGTVASLLKLRWPDGAGGLGGVRVAGGLRPRVAAGVRKCTSRLDQRPCCGQLPTLLVGALMRQVSVVPHGRSRHTYMPRHAAEQTADSGLWVYLRLGLYMRRVVGPVTLVGGSSGRVLLVMGRHCYYVAQYISLAQLGSLDPHRHLRRQQ